jgi:tetratricopeptide (TPR) repeat protein
MPRFPDRAVSNPSEDRVWFATLPLAIRRELGRLLPEFRSEDMESAAPPDYLQLFEGVALLLEHLTQKQPTILILEDLHWADEMSVRLLAFIGRRLGTWRLLLMVTMREEHLVDAPMLQRTLDELEHEPHVATVALGPLSRRDTTTLVEALAREGTDEAAVASLSEQVWRASEGNPFVVVEAMRSAAYGALSPGLEALPLPDRVGAIIGRQLDRLDERSRELVALASVMGREFEFALLQQVSGLEEEEAAWGVEQLTRRRVLHSVGERLDFTHDRVREVAYGRILAPRRRALHRRVAEALATLHVDLELHHLALGLHYAEGEDWTRAVVHLRRAGLTAIERSANREALACFERALAALAHLPETRESAELTIDIHLDLRNALRQLGERARMGEHLHEAEVLARTLGDQRRLARIATFRADERLITGDYNEAVRLGQGALSIARTLGDRSIEMVAMFSLGRTHAARGEFSDAASWFEQNAALEGDLRYERFGTTSIVSAVSGALLAGALCQLGRFEEAIGHAEVAVRIAEAADHPYTLYNGLFELGLAHVGRGDLTRATRALERSLELCRTWQIAVGTTIVAAALGAAYALAGRVADALPLVPGRCRAVPQSTVSRPAGVHASVRGDDLPPGRTDRRGRQPHARGAGGRPPLRGSGKRGPRSLPRRLRRVAGRRRRG